MKKAFLTLLIFQAFLQNPLTALQLDDYKSFYVGYSTAQLHRYRGDFASKGITGILFGIEAGREMTDSSLFGLYLEGNVWPLFAYIQGGYYGIGAGAKMSTQFQNLSAFGKAGLEALSLHHTGNNDNQKNIVGVALQLGADVKCSQNFGVGVALKVAPYLLRAGNEYGALGVSTYIFYRGL